MFYDLFVFGSYECNRLILFVDTHRSILRLLSSMLIMFYIFIFLVLSDCIVLFVCLFTHFLT